MIALIKNIKSEINLPKDVYANVRCHPLIPRMSLWIRGGKKGQNFAPILQVVLRGPAAEIGHVTAGEASLTDMLEYTKFSMDIANPEFPDSVIKYVNDWLENEWPKLCSMTATNTWTDGITTQDSPKK